MEYSETLLTKQELANKLKVTSKTIETWAKEGMPVLKLGAKTVRYDYQQVMEWFTSRTENQKRGDE